MTKKRLNIEELLNDSKPLNEIVMEGMFRK